MFETTPPQSVSQKRPDRGADVMHDSSPRSVAAQLRRAQSGGLRMGLTLSGARCYCGAMPGTETITVRVRQRRHTRLSMWGLWFLVAIPTLLILTCGILILAYQQSVFDVVMGLTPEG